MGAINLVERNSSNIDKIKAALKCTDNSLILSSEGLGGYIKAENQKYDLICLIHENLNDESIFTFVNHVRRSTINHNTPIVVFTDDYAAGVRLLKNFKSIHYIDILGEIEELLLKVNSVLNPPSPERQRIAKLDASIINIFANATINTIVTMAKINNIKFNKPCIFKNDFPYETEISGLADIKSDHFSGYLGVSFPKNTILNLVDCMTGEKFNELCQDVADAAKELNNIVYGQAKKQLSELNYKFPQLIPIVNTGMEGLMKALNSGPTIMIPFETEVGPFVVTVTIKNNK